MNRIVLVSLGILCVALACDTSPTAEKPEKSPTAKESPSPEVSISDTLTRGSWLSDNDVAQWEPEWSFDGVYDGLNENGSNLGPRLRFNDNRMKFRDRSAWTYRFLPNGSGTLKSRFTLVGTVPLYNRSDRKLDEGALEIPLDVRVPMTWKTFDGLVYITPASATVECGDLVINDMPAGEYFERIAYATPPEAASLTEYLESVVEQTIADQETNLPDDGTWKFEAKTVTDDRVALELIERDGGIVLERAK